jgi:hypothetical protein
VNMYLRREHFARTRFTASTQDLAPWTEKIMLLTFRSWTRPVAALIMVRGTRSYGEVS